MYAPSPAYSIKIPEKQKSGIIATISVNMGFDL